MSRKAANAVAENPKVPAMGKSSRRQASRKPDARIRRTRDALGDALVALLHERPFEAITVQQVLDRAGVGRSTFYSHYTDKNDLLLSDAEDFFEGVAGFLSRSAEPSTRVAPVREFFSHVADFHKFRASLVASGKLRDVMELGQGQIARGIEKRLSELPQSKALTPARRAALSQAFAGAMFSLLYWWLGHSKQASPAQMDDLFHQMVWSGVSSPACQKLSPLRVRAR